MVASRAAMGFASIAVSFIMARLLLPEDYGIMQMATVVTGLLSMAQTLGTGGALVQRDHVTVENEQAAFTVSLVVSSALCLAIILIAQPIAVFYDDARVAPVLQALALTFPLGAFTVVPAALMHRDLTMRGNAIANVLAMIAESGTTLGMAWAGYGVWALVGGQFVQVLASVVGLAWYRPWRPGLRFRGGDLRAIARFGGGATASGFLWYAYQNADFFIVGRVLGPAALGTYSMAWKLAKMPWERLWQAVTPLLLPLYSRAKTEPGELGNVLVRLTRFTALVTVPAVVGLATVGHDVVLLFLGPRWADTAAPLVWLSGYMAIRSVMALLPFVLMAVGRIRQEVAFNFGCALVMPAAFAVAVGWGTTGVAIAWAVVWPTLGALWLVPKALQAADLTWRRWLGSMVRPLAATGVMIAAVVALGVVIVEPGALRLVIRVAGGAAAYLTVIRVLEGPFKPLYLELARGIGR